MGDPDRPKVITICGSTRFSDAQAIAMMHLSLMGHVVIPCGMMGHVDEPQGAEFFCDNGNPDDPRKQALDKLHFRKIDRSDGIFVVNLGGYVGESTYNEIRYAIERMKTVEFMFPDAIPADVAALFPE